MRTHIYIPAVNLNAGNGWMVTQRIYQDTDSNLIASVNWCKCNNSGGVVTKKQ